jgi:hypothetical protein
VSKAVQTPNWAIGLDAARKASRCGAKTRRCTACASPAMPNSRCRMHGGTSTGARTVEGLARCRVATLKHGKHTAPAREAARRRGEARRLMPQLEVLLRAVAKHN